MRSIGEKENANTKYSNRRVLKKTKNKNTINKSDKCLIRSAEFINNNHITIDEN